MPATSTSGGGSFAETTGDAGRDALLASIRGAGGIGALRKVDKSQLDKPSVLLQEARGESASPPAAAGNGGTAGGPPASLADALAAALNKRKLKWELMTIWTMVMIGNGKQTKMKLLL